MSGEVNRKIGKLVFLDNKRCKNKGAANSLRRLLIRHFPFFSKKKKKPNGFLEKPWTHLSRKRHPEAKDEIVSGGGLARSPVRCSLPGKKNLRSKKETDPTYTAGPTTPPYLWKGPIASFFSSPSFKRRSSLSPRCIYPLKIRKENIIIAKR